jgi:hypothetical protein
MKTSGVALVACLNIGTDPPDVAKPANCARRECWLDPTMNSPKEKILSEIGNALQRQYEKWQSKAKYKQVDYFTPAPLPPPFNIMKKRFELYDFIVPGSNFRRLKEAMHKS